VRSWLLNCLFFDGLLVTFRNATDVNGRGQIVGQGYLDGEFRAFLLTPVTSPVVSLTGKPADPSASASASFVFGSDPGSSFECSLDDGAYAACTTPQSYAGLADGRHLGALGFRVPAQQG
jgi:hypothetical protein